MKVIRLSRRPPCEATVRVSATDTRTRAYRAAQAARAGRPIDQCGRPSYYKVGERCMCLAHAGLTALHHLMGES